MLHRFCRTTLEWRRAPEVELVKVAGVEFANDDGSDRQEILRGCQETMRVVMRRPPNKSHDPNGVELFVKGRQQIGYLFAEVAAQVRPLLDSDRTIFDVVIWSVDEFTAGDGGKLIACTIAITRFERVPVQRFLWNHAMVAAARGTAASARWTVDRSTFVLGWLGRSACSALRTVVPSADG
jgi:hypothetical protein